MKKLAFLFAVLLLVSVVGCSSGDSVTGSDTSDQVQADNVAQKPTGDPHDGMTGPKTPGDPGTSLGGPN